MKKSTAFAAAATSAATMPAVSTDPGLAADHSAGPFVCDQSVANRS